MKFGQLITYRWEVLFFKNHTENETGRLVPVLLLCFKAPCKVKASFQPLVLIEFGRPPFGHTIKNKPGSWSRDILNFDFLWKGPGLVSPYFVYDF